MKMYDIRQKSSKEVKILLLKLYNQQKVPFKNLRELINITLDKHAPLKKRSWKCRARGLNFLIQKVILPGKPTRNKVTALLVFKQMNKKVLRL